MVTVDLQVTGVFSKSCFCAVIGFDHYYIYIKKQIHYDRNYVIQCRNFERILYFIDSQFSASVNKLQPEAGK